MLHVIAGGATRHNEIQNVIRADPTGLLDRLVGLRLVERVQPVTETGRTRRRTYRIADNLLAFHLDVLGRYRSEIETGLGPSVLPVLLDSLDDHQGPRWEAAFRQGALARTCPRRRGDMGTPGQRTPAGRRSPPEGRGAARGTGRPAGGRLRPRAGVRRT